MKLRKLLGRKLLGWSGRERSLKFEPQRAIWLGSSSPCGGALGRHHTTSYNMAAPPSAYQDRHFLAVIGDEVGSGFSLAPGFVIQADAALRTL